MIRRAIIALLVLVLLSSCTKAPTPPPNVLLIVVDTLRADRLGVYGGKRGLTPFLDSLAQRSTRFQHAVAACPWTNPSVASIMTSRYQSQHGIVTFASPLASTEVTLAEVLHERGYATAGFTANALLQSKSGYAQGFDEYQALWSDTGANMVKFRAAAVNEKILAWLDGRAAPQRTQPAFIYVQYIEPHLPYNPPAAALAKLSGAHPPDLVAVNGLATLGIAPKDSIAQFDDVYDAEVMSLDEGVKDLFAALQQRRFLDNALVIFTADHGEQIMEHDALGHGNSLHGEEVDVPLIMLAPAQRSGAVVDDPVSLLDIAPTVVSAAGGAQPPTFVGRPLALAGQVGEARPVLTQLIIADDVFKPVPRRPGDAVVLGRQKLIAGVDGTEEFYDLAADPIEQHPDGLGEDDRARLRAALQSVRANSDARPAIDAPPIDPATAERMRALGYLK